MAKTELEQFSIDVSTKAFTQAYLNDLFWLNHLVDNPNAYDAFMWELIDKWTIPTEPEDTDEEIFTLMCQKENDARD